MDEMRNLAMIFFGMILVNNYVLVQFLGICPFLGVSKKLDSAFGMSCAVIFVMAIATAVTWPIYTYVLEPNGMAYLQTIVFILIIAVLVQLVEIVLKKFIPPLYKALGVYLPLITTNCAVLGVTISVIDEGYNFRRKHGVRRGRRLRLHAGHGAVRGRAPPPGGRKAPQVL